jgi:isoleucyl-tRNA synthetase
LRKKEKLRVRQPLQKIMVPVLNAAFAEHIQHVQELILSEVNVKQLELLDASNNIFVKSIKPNFKTIGPKYGQQMKAISALVAQFDQAAIAAVEQDGGWTGDINGTVVALDLADFEIRAEDIPGWLVASENGITVALDATLTDELRSEGIARELVNRVQNLRKDSGLEVTDRIRLSVSCAADLATAITANKAYICSEVLANDLIFEEQAAAHVIDLVHEGDAKISLSKD